MAAAATTSFVRIGILANITRKIFTVKGQSARETVHAIVGNGTGEKKRNKEFSV